MNEQTTRWGLLHAGLALVAIGCAHAPSTFPALSAAAPEARAATPSIVARAVTEEPPLPGTSTDGWTGLAPPTGDPHAGHHHMHHAPPAPPPDAQPEEGSDDAE